MNPVFVVGITRSGTTLISSMLSAHPSIAIAPDLHYVYGWYQQGRQLDLTRPADFERFWRAFTRSERFGYLGIDPDAVRRRIEAERLHSFRGVYVATLETYAADLGKRRWGEKTPLAADHLDTLFEWFPDARVLYMLRDPRAVVSSLRKTPWGSETGVHVHAHAWAAGVARALAREEDSRVLTIRYENLVCEPVGELQRICAFLGEDYSPAMIDGRDSLSRSTLRDRQGWEKEHLSAALRPVHKSSIEMWRRELAPVEVDIVEHCCRRVMQQTDYAPVGKPLSVARQTRVLIEGAATRFGQRASQSAAARKWRKITRALKRFLPAAPTVPSGHVDQ